MRQKQSLAVLSIGAALPSMAAQSPSVVAVGPNGSMCPAIPTTVTYVLEGVYSSVFETAGTIYNFMGGTNSVVINNVPTTIVSTVTITSSVVQTGPITGLPGTGLSTSATGTNPSSSLSTSGAGGGSSSASTTANTSPLPSNLCPSSNGTVVGGYSIICGQGINGQDIDAGIQVPSFEDCILRCEADNRCVSVSFNTDSKFCYRHSTLFSALLNQPEVNSAVLSSSNPVNSSSSSSTSSNGSTSSIQSTTNSGTSTTRLTQGSATSSSNPSSSAASTSSGTSTVFTSAGGSSTSASSSATSSSGPGLCPSQNNQVVDGYRLLCGRGGFGNNVPGTGQLATSFEVCIQRCRGTAECVGVSYETDVANGACYLYTSFDRPNDAQTIYDTAVLDSVYQSGSPSSASSSSSGSSSGTSTAGTTTLVTAASTTGGLGTTNPQTSSTGASSISSSIVSIPTGTLAPSSSSGTATAPASTASGLCPGSNNKDVNGYHIFCNAGGVGTNIPGTFSASSFEDCISQCTQTRGCVGASYQNNVLNGACYLYSTFERSNPAQQIYDTAVSLSVYNGNSGSSSAAATTSNVGTATTTIPAVSPTTSDICPAGNNNVVDGYHIYCNKGGVGHNLGQGQLRQTFADCLQLCSSTPGCIGATHEKTPNGACYLYDSFDSTNDAQIDYDTGVLNSYLAGGSGTGTTSVPVASSTVATSPASTTAPVLTTSSSVGGQGTVTITVPSTTTSALIVQTASPCPNQNGAQYQNFEVYCDRPVNGASNLPGYENGAIVASLQGCLDLCQQLNTDGNSCTSVAYDVQHSVCYPHSGAAVVGAQDIAYQGAIYNGPAPTAQPTGGATTTATTSPLPAYTDAPCQSGYTGDSDFIVKCGRAITGTNINPGGDVVGSFDDCIQLCRDDATCVSVSYANNPGDGHCYLHSADEQYNTDLGYHSAVKASSNSPLKNQP